MSNSGYHVTISAFVPFDPKSLETVAQQASVLKHLAEGSVLDATQLSGLAPAVSKTVTFMTKLPKHMEDALKDVVVPEPKTDAKPAAKK